LHAHRCYGKQKNPVSIRSSKIHVSSGTNKSESKQGDEHEKNNVLIKYRTTGQNYRKINENYTNANNVQKPHSMGEIGLKSHVLCANMIFKTPHVVRKRVKTTTVPRSLTTKSVTVPQTCFNN
jgi:hypothetical protein